MYQYRAAGDAICPEKGGNSGRRCQQAKAKAAGDDTS